MLHLVLQAESRSIVDVAVVMTMKCKSAADIAGGDYQVSMQVKRRWDDDVVFRNQERGEPKLQKRFVNDTIRNDFHRRFLNRYIK